MGSRKVFTLFQESGIPQFFPETHILGRPLNLFWECRRYDLLIPVTELPLSELDIFEDAVLRMTAIRNSSAKELADILCLSRDLVLVILIRLQEKGYLKDAHTVSDQGSRFLKEDMEARKSVKTINASLFVVPQTGQILPYIHQSSMTYADVYEDRGGITLVYGPPGAPRYVRGRYLSIGRQEQPRRITPAECRNAVQIYNKLADGSRYPVISFTADGMMEASAAERVFLHMQMALRRGDRERPVVSDGFVQNVDGLSDYLKRSQNELFKSALERAVVFHGTENTPDTQSALWKDSSYYELRTPMEKVRELVRNINNEADTPDAIAQQGSDKRELVRQASILLEWVLFYYTSEHPVSQTLLRELERGNASSNLVLLRALAEKIGITDTKTVDSLLSRLDGQQIRHVYRERTPNFSICFPLAVAEAGENGSGLFLRLLQEKPTFPARLNTLFQAYTALRHGTEQGTESLEGADIYHLCKNCVEVLLPDFHQENRLPANAPQITADSAEITARLSLEDAIGSMYFQTLPPLSQEDWMKLSPGRSHFPDAYNYVNILYRQMERSVYEAYINRRHSSLSGKEAVLQAEERWGSPLPRTLTTVREKFLTAMQHNGRASLGAAVLLLLCCGSDRLISQLRQRAFVPCVDQVITLRGHGNNVGLCVDSDALHELRNQVMKLCRCLEGFEDGQ